MDAAEVKAAADRRRAWKAWQEWSDGESPYWHNGTALLGDQSKLADAYLELEPLVRAAVAAWRNGHDHSVACALKLMREVVGDG